MVEPALVTSKVRASLPIAIDFNPVAEAPLPTAKAAALIVVALLPMAVALPL